MRNTLLAIAVTAAMSTPPFIAHADPGDTTFGGKMFIDFTNLNQTRNGVDTDKNGTGIDVKRFYLVVDHEFDDVWSANLTTDFNYVSSDGETNLFVKKAYVQGHFSDAAVFRAGSADLPWVPFVEGYYGYRYVENILIDRLKFGTSADWGLHLGGKVGQAGIFNYATSVVNGGGYKHPDRTDSVDFSARVGFEPLPGLVVALGGYSGKLGQDTNTSPALHTANRGDALVAYNANGLRLGAEYFTARNWNNVATVETDKADGYSGWASYAFTPTLAVFGRYDHAKPSKDLDPTRKDTYTNAGIEWAVQKGIKLAFVYKHDKLENDVDLDQKTNEVGVWGEVKF